MISLDSEVVISAAIVATEVDGAVTIFNPATDRYYTLDGVGAAIWQLLEGGSALGAIRDHLLERYETSAETCEHDLLALVGQLGQEGLVEVSEP